MRSSWPAQVCSAWPLEFLPVVCLIQSFIFSSLSQYKMPFLPGNGSAWPILLFPHSSEEILLVDVTNKKLCVFFFFSPTQYNITAFRQLLLVLLGLFPATPCQVPKCLSASINILPLLRQTAVTSHWTNLPGQLTKRREQKTTHSSSTESRTVPERVLILALKM